MLSSVIVVDVGVGGGGEGVVVESGRFWYGDGGIYCLIDGLVVSVEGILRLGSGLVGRVGGVVDGAESPFNQVGMVLYSSVPLSSILFSSVL